MEQFLLLSRDLHFDPRAVQRLVRRSAGRAAVHALRTTAAFAVDADADGSVDLWTDYADVCESVGHYFKEHGWNTGEPVLIDATVTPNKPDSLDGRKLDLSETIASLQAKGVAFDSPLPTEAPALLVAADESDATHWRVGFNNFYVITRYNHSPLYAMAVYELAGALKERVSSMDYSGPTRRRAQVRPRENDPCMAAARLSGHGSFADGVLQFAAARSAGTRRRWRRRRR